MSKIPIPQFILDEVANCSDTQQTAIEAAKKKNGVDDFIAGSILDVLAGKGKLYTANKDELLKTIETSIDKALLLIALCKDEINVEEIGRRVIQQGRRRQVWDPGNNQELEARLRQTFAEIDKEFRLHVNGKNDRKMLRKKVRSAAHLIEEFINQKNASYQQQHPNQ